MLSVHILKMPCFVSSMGAFRATPSERPRTLLRSDGLTTPSSHSLLVE